MIANGKTIAVNYRPGAGGNFLQNCLGLSRHCVLRDLDYVQWQLQAQVDADFYQQKLSWVKSTVAPVPFDTSWLGYELGSHRLIGFLFSDSRPTTVQDIPAVVHDAAALGFWTTHTAHNHGWTEHLTRYWPQVRYVNVLGDNWAKQWMHVKNHTLEWRVWKPSPDAYNFDFDTVIHSCHEFSTAMQDLYAWLGWDDFDHVPLAEYYDCYYQAHVDHLKITTNK